MATALRDSDYMTQLVSYIEKNLSKGYNVDQLKIVLIQQGYSRAAVERAIKITEDRRPKHVEIKEEPKIEPVVEPIVEEKKPGFFARLFGLGKKKDSGEVVNV